MDQRNETSQRQNNKHLPLVKQYWKPAFSTNLALKASKQAGPRKTPGDSKILLSARAGGSAAVALHTRLENLTPWLRHGNVERDQESSRWALKLETKGREDRPWGDEVGDGEETARGKSAELWDRGRREVKLIVLKFLIILLSQKSVEPNGSSLIELLSFGLGNQILKKIQ